MCRPAICRSRRFGLGGTIPATNGTKDHRVSQPRTACQVRVRDLDQAGNRSWMLSYRTVRMISAGLSFGVQEPKPLEAGGTSQSCGRCDGKRRNNWRRRLWRHARAGSDFDQRSRLGAFVPHGSDARNERCRMRVAYLSLGGEISVSVNIVDGVRDRRLRLEPQARACSAWRCWPMLHRNSPARASSRKRRLMRGHSPSIIEYQAVSRLRPL